MISDDVASNAVRMVAPFLSGDTMYVGGGGAKLTVDVKGGPATYGFDMHRGVAAHQSKHTVLRRRSIATHAVLRWNAIPIAHGVRDRAAAARSG